MKLSDVFESIAYKTLVSVDLPDRVSNQHEINGVSALRDFFGTDEKIEEEIFWSYFSDSEETITDNGFITFYDARANHPSRTEWRLYYSGNFLSVADSGDLFVLGRKKSDENLVGLVFDSSSSIARSVKSLLGVEDEQVSNMLINVPHRELAAWELDLVDRLILEDAGFESIAGEFASHDEQLVLDEFGIVLPSTAIFSSFARDHSEVDLSDPDETLVRWIDRETTFFDIILKNQIENRINQGFASTDDFITYAVSLTNTRKARMGFSFENHIEALLIARSILFDRGKTTEGKSKPDFIFPGISYYHQDDFPIIYLSMLGAKSTCKDRWRQVLKEADKISHKHLCTLERGISVDQTEEMRQGNVTLVVPEQFHRTYTPGQRHDLMSLKDFMQFVEEKQKRAAFLL